MSKKAPPKKPDAGGDAAPKSGRKKLVIGLVALLALGGGGGWFFLRRPPAADHAVEEVKPVAFLDVQEMMVNLAAEPNSERPRYLKLKVALEVQNAKVAGEVQPLMPRVQDVLQVFVRELRPSELEGSGGVYRLREELLRRANLAVYPSRIDAVLFKEVVLQ